MLRQLLPQRVDNTYSGHQLALWLFALIVLLKVAVSLNTIFDGSSVAASADGIPLDTFPADAAQAVVSLSAIWALSHLVICLLCVLVLVRYRGMIPFMFALLLLEHLGRRLILYLMPLVKTGTPPGFYVNLILLVLLSAGLALSLRGRDQLQARA